MRRQRSRRLIAVTPTLTPEQLARLEARAALQQISRAEVLRTLIAALPEPTRRAGTRGSPQSPATNTSPSKRISTPGD